MAAQGKLGSWVGMMWRIMGHTGEGYRRHSLKNSGKGLDRRNDKLREVASINEDGEPEIVFLERKEGKMQRKFRLAVPVFVKKRGRARCG